MSYVTTEHYAKIRAIAHYEMDEEEAYLAEETRVLEQLEQDILTPDWMYVVRRR